MEQKLKSLLRESEWKEEPLGSFFMPEKKQTGEEYDFQTLQNLQKFEKVS